jgi:glycosyltransferase involved in cell wall biosynthesis
MIELSRRYGNRMRESKYGSIESTPNRIFVDASFTLSSGKNTGIERVVRSILVESSQVCDVPLTTVFSHRNHFYAVDSNREKVLARPRDFQGNAMAHLPQWYKSFASTVCRLLPFRSLKKWLMPYAGHLGMFKIPHLWFESYCRRQAATADNLVSPGAGDIVLLPDAYWTEEQVWGAARQARQRGAFIATLIYDLIPMTHPEYVGERRRVSFVEYFRNVASHSDLIITISDTVRSEVEEQLPRLCSGQHYCQNVRGITLGAELAESHGPIRQNIREIFADDGDNNPYIMVGSFDPRKNHAFLLDAFERLWKSGSQRRLCFIGRVGALSRDIVERMYSHAEFGKRLLTFHDLTDCELHHCYRQSRGVLMASTVEGFGLPIVEALWHGKKTFVSNTAIHREVGGQYCEYFDLADPIHLTRLIDAWEDRLLDGASLNPVNYRPVSWRESVALLFDACLSEFARHSTPTQKIQCVA